MFIKLFVLSLLYINIHSYKFNKVSSILYLETDQKLYDFIHTVQVNLFVINPCDSEFLKINDPTICLKRFTVFKDLLRTKCSDSNIKVSQSSTFSFLGIWNYGKIFEIEDFTTTKNFDDLKERLKSQVNKKFEMLEIEGFIFDELSSKLFDLIEKPIDNIVSMTNNTEIIENLFEDDFILENCYIDTSELNPMSDMYINLNFKGYTKSYSYIYQIECFDIFDKNVMIRYELPSTFLISTVGQGDCEISDTFSKEKLIKRPDCLGFRNSFNKTKQYIPFIEVRREPILYKIKNEFVVFCPDKKILINDERIKCPKFAFSLPLDTLIGLELFNQTINETYINNELNQNLLYFEKLFGDVNDNETKIIQKDKNFFELLEQNFFLIFLLVILMVGIAFSIKLIYFYSQCKYEIKLIKYKHQLID